VLPFSLWQNILLGGNPLSVATLPQVGQYRLLQLKATVLVWEQSGLEQAYFLYPITVFPQLSILITLSITL